MICSETLYDPHGKPIGHMKAQVEKSSFRFEPLDANDSRFTSIQGRRFGNPVSLKKRIQAACVTTTTEDCA